MAPAARLRLVALPPKQEGRIGQVCHISAQVESSSAVEVTIESPASVLDLVTATPTQRLEAGTHTVNWTFYATRASADPVRLKIDARAEDLHQTAELILRITNSNVRSSGD